MNPGQYYHRLQNHGPPITFQYTQNSDSPLQSVHGMLSLDGLPRTQSDQNFLTSTSTPNIASPNYSLANPTPMSQAPLTWAGPNQMASGFEDQHSNSYYGYSANIAGNTSDGSFLRGVNFEIPRYMPDNIGVHSDNHMLVDVYDPSLYMVDPNKPDSQMSSSGRLEMPYNGTDNSRNFSRLSIYASPEVERDITGGRTLLDQSPFRLLSSETSEDGGDGDNSSREMTAVEGEEPAADEPYAKLIYRALMSAPNHSMVLQEIYQWFRDNTVKGSSDTKGWMNSIRHNLSMNAAFKKTERKILGDETKKSTEWVLEDFAIKDGVQSTTRYRKGNNAKKVVRTDNLGPARQSSGRKGAMQTRELNQRQRVKEERRVSRRPTPRVGIPSPMPYVHRAHATQQQRSPLTPPQHVLSSSPYYFPKPEHFEMPFEDMCSLEDVQGVYIDDGPLFSNDQEPHFHTGHSMSSQPY